MYDGRLNYLFQRKYNRPNRTKFRLHHMQEYELNEHRVAAQSSLKKPFIFTSDLFVYRKVLGCIHLNSPTSLNAYIASRIHNWIVLQFYTHVLYACFENVDFILNRERGFFNVAYIAHSAYFFFSFLRTFNIFTLSIYICFNPLPQFLRILYVVFFIYIFLK